MKSEAEVALPNVVDLLLDAICVVDVEGRFLYVSAACERIFGYRPEELIGRPMIELVAPQDRERTLLAAREIMAGQPMLNFENRYRRKDGQLVHILWSARWSESQRVRIAVARDITLRKRAELLQAALYAISEAAHAAKDLHGLFVQVRCIIGELLSARHFFVALGDCQGKGLDFFCVQGEGSLVPAVSAAAERLGTEIVRSGQSLLLPAQRQEDRVDGAQHGCWLGAPLVSQQGIIGALVLQDDADGPGYGDKDRELLQFVSTQVATAVERKRLYARLEHAAQYDGLTGLANRALLFDRLQSALARAHRNGQGLALLYLDLDRFKQVNDTLGHAVGDRLLQEVARRLREVLRDSDTAARVGGDEFVVLLEALPLAEHARRVAEKIAAALSRPVDLDGYRLAVAASIGIAIYPEDGETEAVLLARADAAMYGEKAQRAAGARVSTLAVGGGDG